jgi:hypothetical protein
MISIISHVPTDEMLQLFDEGNHVADRPFRASTKKGRTFKIMYNGNVLRTWTPVEEMDTDLALPAHALPRTSRRTSKVPEVEAEKLQWGRE